MFYKEAFEVASDPFPQQNLVIQLNGVEIYVANYRIGKEVNWTKTINFRKAPHSKRLHCQASIIEEILPQNLI